MLPSTNCGGPPGSVFLIKICQIILSALKGLWPQKYDMTTDWFCYFYHHHTAGQQYIQAAHSTLPIDMQAGWGWAEPSSGQAQLH